MDYTREQWAALSVEERGACVLTTHARNRQGYGRTGAKRFGKRINYHHVLTWIDVHGMLPSEEFPHVLHHCDNPPCINPEHLFAGNQKLNMQDCAAKGRNNRKTVCEVCGGERVQRPSGARVCPICDAQYHAEWREENRERVRAYALKYYHEKGASTRSEYLARTRESRLEQRRAKYDAEKARERWEKQSADPEFREKRRVYMRDYRKQKGAGSNLV